MENYKEDILSTRCGYLGSSDAQMMAQVDLMGRVPKTAYKRLAICKNLIPPQDGVKTRAMEFGDFIEQSIFVNLSANNHHYQSNPRWESVKYSRKNVKCISHPDIVLVDDDNKTLHVWEVKATKDSIEETRHKYRAQLYHHLLLAKEIATKTRYRVRLYLCHYNTNDVDIDAPFEFDPSRLTIKETKFSVPVFDLANAMDIIDSFLDTFNEYYEEDIVDATLLPMPIQEQFAQMSIYLREIKDRESKLDKFKAALYDFFSEKGIKRVACDDFSFTLVAPTESVSVDYKEMFAKEIEEKTPYKAKRLKEQYKKVTKKKGYIAIKVK